MLKCIDIHFPYQNYVFANEPEQEARKTKKKNAVDLELYKMSRGDKRSCLSLMGIVSEPCKSLHIGPDTNVYQNAQKTLRKIRTLFLPQNISLH